MSATTISHTKKSRGSTPCSLTNMQQAPIRNANIIGASVYSHSGEFAPACADLRLPGRGLDLQFIRSYRSSLADHIGELGRGWSSSVAKKIEREGDNIIYHNGAGEVYKFHRKAKDGYTSPFGFYGILSQEDEQFLMPQRYGLTYRFETPGRGGRIVSIEDRNQNAIQFSYSDSGIVIIDTLKRKVTIAVTKGLLREVKDHAERTWRYIYDRDDRLIEVVQPTTTHFTNGTSVKYGYDNNHRLMSITDAKGQKYLVNHYDMSGKIVCQEHGNSGVFKMEYKAIDKVKTGFPSYRTTCIRKNGSKIVLEHNEVGNVLSRTLHVRKESFTPEDTADISGKAVPLITKSAYNRNSELTSRIFPAGNKIERIYSEDEKEPLNRGNLLRITKSPHAGVESDQKRLVTKYEYEPKFQFANKLIDPRGNKTSYQYDEKGNLIVTTYPSVSIQPVGGAKRASKLNRTQQSKYAYNSMGQLLRRTHIDGSVTEYHYYPVDDPCGTRGLSSATDAPDRVCGYLARVVQDADGAKVRNEYAYDLFGNVAAVFDGKSNAARLRYNAMGKVESMTARDPFKHRIDYKYDANYNEIESAQSFERFVYDEATQKRTLTWTTLRELKEYNALDNITERRIVGDDKIVTESFIRDANERIVHQIQPLGNITEYVFDERDLLIKKIFAVSTKETFTNRFTYTLNGAIRSQTDGNGNTTTHRYDGFQRYRGFTNPLGTTKKQSFDESDNVIRVRVDCYNGSSESNAARRKGAPLMEASYHFDEWDRAYRMDQAWHDLTTGEAVGESKWNGEKGIVSTVVEYAENGLPGKVWTESDNVLGFEYDGVGRIARMNDLTGEEVYFAYDENSNLILVKHLGPEVEGRRFERLLRRDHDEMDRPYRLQENDDAPEQYIYNALGNVIKYVAKSGLEVQHTDDSLGRRVGHVFTIEDPWNHTEDQKIVRRFDYDDNYRLSGYIDAAGKPMAYHYDALDHQTGIDFPDGSAANAEYDANGNIVKEVNQNNTEITSRYDAANRLVERRSLIKKMGKEVVERFEYDGLNRLVAAIAADAVIRRTYDSLSRLLTEQQGKHALRCAYDSAGNLTSLLCPSGEEVHTAYDPRNRVSSVTNKLGETIATFKYRANQQVAKMWLGNVIATAFHYNPQERLESIEYRRTNDHALVEGFRYRYDNTGKMIHEIQLSAGSTYGERYYYDNANRATKAQYGVQNVLDPGSPFAQETSYEHFPERSWKRRTDVDGQRKIIDEKVGTINQLNNYEHFGKIAFVYDLNGNCIRKGTPNPGHCDYIYDQDNRVIKSTCYDADGNETQTIEYFYDSFGRQVRKVVTDRDGKTTDYTYVWIRNVLLEEYENGVLVRSYLYGYGSIPVQLSVNGMGYYYTRNGKGLASGLLPKRDLYAFAEKYGYDVTGFSFITEIGGMKVDIAARSSTSSSVLNSILSGGYLRDWQNGTNSRLGRQTNPAIGAVLNGLGHNRTTDAFWKQAQEFFNMAGLGGSGKAATGAAHTAFSFGSVAAIGGTGSTNPARNMGLVGMHDGKLDESDDPSDAPVDDAPLSDPPLVSADPLAPVDDDTSQSRGDLGGPSTSGSAHGTGLYENAARLYDYIMSGPSGIDTPVGTVGPGPGFGIHLGWPLGMPNPDSTSGSGSGSGPVSSPFNVEARFMQNKRPVNPNDSVGAPPIDTSFSPSHSPGGIDPTIALYDGESGGTAGILITGSPSNILKFIGGGFTDFMHSEFDAPGPGGGGTVPNGRP